MSKSIKSTFMKMHYKIRQTDFKWGFTC